MLHDRGKILSFAPAIGQVEKIERIAEMIHASRSAAIRNLIEAGFEHLQEEWDVWKKKPTARLGTRPGTTTKICLLFADLSLTHVGMGGRAGQTAAFAAITDAFMIARGGNDGRPKIANELWPGEPYLNQVYKKSER